MPLKKQCEAIAVPMYETVINKSNFLTEIDVLNDILIEGNRGVAAESAPFKGILYVIGAALLRELKFREAIFSDGTFGDIRLERLTASTFFEVNNYRGNSMTGPGSKWYAKRHSIDFVQEITRAVQNTNLAKFRLDLDSVPEPNFSRSNPKLSKRFLLDFFNAIEGEKLDLLFDFVRENPIGHLLGWPDLTILTNENKVVLIEVKSTDKLRYKQIRTLSRITPIIDHVCVLKVKRTIP
jgi:hypothetical protein